ncbi:D-alanine--D-alanine ligase family protein [Maridesulfovibrio hydrothermalis]|uniref:D-alanine--D-alanine ligase n=1 Tax=Maridesulfovibrio hydrothermalis AM13 = DSM 14728 TaxID=1121451 RepID=L0RCM7_9BACT|nr:D-alanine--D-alanine ligase [Maridesulfovibrio hydrothermalis]CCO23935.1 D-alanine--D-alanine ligase [Maridesulfovibrio hydrothermalis AM13 = DSM 14728]
MHVLLIAGGWSDEREVSISGAEGIHKALLELGHEVEFLDPATDFENILTRAEHADFAFINLHGSPGEDGLIQAILNQTNCPYQGSEPEGSFLTLHKAAAKIIFDKNSIRNPAWELICETEGCKGLEKLSPPVFIKPNSGGSSLGMTLARTDEELKTGIETVFNLGDSALVEDYITGTEVTCAVLDGKPLPLVLITPPEKAEFFDYHSKYALDGAEEICPAPIDAALTEEIQQIAIKVHKLLGLSDYSRADFIISEGVPYLLEVNTLPGMTPTSLVPRAAKAAGYSFNSLIAKLIELGQSKRK